MPRLLSFTIALLLVFSAASLFVGCDIMDAVDVEEDNFNCRTLCDKKRACDPSLSDGEWDACFNECLLARYPRGVGNCVRRGSCNDGFHALVEACVIDPWASAEEEWADDAEE